VWVRVTRTLAVLLAAASLASPAAAAAKSKVAARGSADQVYATGLSGGEVVTLLAPGGRTVASQRADSLGGVLFRGVAPGRGYRVTAHGVTSGPLTVYSERPAPPSTAVYGQALPRSGYGYLITRDGTKLAIDIHLPGGAGPYPTLVEYSGYGYADPYNGPDSGIASVANLLGFAVVDVNMRGSGCSGGAFDYFEPLQSLDGYDVVETVARQPWVLHHEVGMIGISYGGVSQMFVAATDPPHLAAIAPLSVYDDPIPLLDPGGILNTGFALQFAKDRVHDAMPASRTAGQAWALKRIRQGDAICKANQVLHGEAVNLVTKIRSNPYFVPSVVDPQSPITLVHKITVPVYLACQWTDEQTGGHCADLAEHFTGARRKWFTFTNGVHGDSLDPTTGNRWFDFLGLFVARRAPVLPPGFAALEPTLFNLVFGIGGMTLPPDPLQGLPSYQAALAAFELLPPVRILFDNGAGGSAPGVPGAGFEQSFPRFPLPGTRAVAWYLNGSGTLTSSKPTRPATDAFTWNPRARPPTSYTGSDSPGPGGGWIALPPYNWTQNPAGTAASYLTAPLAANTVVVGGGAVQLWIKAAAPSVDLQVTVSDVRPDGNEVFVQNGWLRASERKLDPRRSTLLYPVPSFRQADVAPLPAGRFTELTVPLFFEGHAYRAGSRIRITIAAPGGDQAVWAFSQTIPSHPTKVWIAHSRRMPSRVILPVVSGIAVPTALPPCPGLRGEPCRRYVP
jgi:predicted acyl esterase